MNIAILLIILLAGSIITFVSGNKYASKVALTFSVIAAAFSIFLLCEYHTTGLEYSLEWVKNPHLTFSLKLDGLSLLMILLNTILVPIMILVYIPNKVQSEKLLYSLVMFTSFAMTGVFLSSDALLYYVFWEASLIPIYFIIILWGNGDKLKRRNSAITFFMYTFAGSLFMLASMIYLYTKAGSFQLQDFYAVSLTKTEQIWVFLGFFLAYAIKIPIFPFHSWQANVYQRAPLIGTLLLGALMSKMALYSVIRWQLPITPYASEALRDVILILCILGVIYGSIIVLKHDNIKRFFAYVSLAHVGLISAGIYSVTFDGLLGAVIMIMAHGFGTVGLFFAGDIIFRRTQKYKISQMGGIKSQAPWFTMSFLLLVLASIALPLSFNFVGEFTILYGVFQVNIWFLLFLGSSMFLGAFYMFRMYQNVMLGESNSSFNFIDLRCSEGIVFILLIAVILFFGVYSKPIVELVSPTLQGIITVMGR